MHHASARQRGGIFASMEDRAEVLRRRIELYRRYLREGVDAALAEIYLKQIAEDEAELAGIDDTEKRRR